MPSSRFVILTSCTAKQHKLGELLRFSKKEKKKEALCLRKGASVTRDPRQEECRVHAGRRKAEKQTSWQQQDLSHRGSVFRDGLVKKSARRRAEVEERKRICYKSKKKKQETLVSTVLSNLQLGFSSFYSPKEAEVVGASPEIGASSEMWPLTPKP